jgi:hypothetical protein
VAIRTISNVAYRRNRTFWQRRQRRGDEIRVTRLQRVIAIFYGLRHMRFGDGARTIPSAPR